METLNAEHTPNLKAGIKSLNRIGKDYERDGDRLRFWKRATAVIDKSSLKVLKYTKAEANSRNAEINKVWRWLKSYADELLEESQTLRSQSFEEELREARAQEMEERRERAIRWLETR